jgi:hypothetical protein
MGATQGQIEINGHAAARSIPALEDAFFGPQPVPEIEARLGMNIRDSERATVFDWVRNELSLFRAGICAVDQDTGRDRRHERFARVESVPRKHREGRVGWAAVETRTGVLEAELVEEGSIGARQGGLSGIERCATGGRP